MPHRFCAVLLFVGILVSACAAHQYRPIVDFFQGKTRQQYEIELQERQQYASQVSPETEAAVGAVGGAAVGSALGAIVGAFFGYTGDGAAMGAAVGGFSGATSGAGHSMASQGDITRRCIQARGWNVLR